MKETILVEINIMKYVGDKCETLLVTKISADEIQ